MSDPLLKEIRDRLADLPDRLAKAMGGRGSPGEGPETAKPPPKLYDDRPGKFDALTGFGSALGRFVPPAGQLSSFARDIKAVIDTFKDARAAFGPRTVPEGKVKVVKPRRVPKDKAKVVKPRPTRLIRTRPTRLAKPKATRVLSPAPPAAAPAPTAAAPALPSPSATAPLPAPGAAVSPATPTVPPPRPPPTAPGPGVGTSAPAPSAPGLPSAPGAVGRGVAPSATPPMKTPAPLPVGTPGAGGGPPPSGVPQEVAGLLRELKGSIDKLSDQIQRSDDDRTVDSDAVPPAVSVSKAKAEESTPTRAAGANLPAFQPSGGGRLRSHIGQAARRLTGMAVSRIVGRLNPAAGAALRQLGG